MRHASLFSGIGGPEVAAAMMGWANIFHCEINEFGRKVLEYWFPESDSYEDITKTRFEQYRGKVDVLTGGFPCQPFSYAGQRKGQADQRYLWPEMLRVISEVRPTWVIGENVAGIATMVEQCKEYDLVSPIYESSHRGGCWFCPNCKIPVFAEFRKKHPELWEKLRQLSLTPNLCSYGFKYGMTLQEVEARMDAIDAQLTLF